MSLIGDHVCFGCNKRIEPEQPHIHGSPTQYLHEDASVLDQILPDVVFCEPCTVPGGEFSLHRHRVDPPSGFADILKS